MHYFTCWTLFISRINRTWLYEGLNDWHRQQNSGLAQLAEHRTDGLEVVGSILGRDNCFYFTLLLQCWQDLAGNLELCKNSIERNPTVCAIPTVDFTDVTLSLKLTFQWKFSGLKVNVCRCFLDFIGMKVKPESPSKDGKQIVENQEIVIHNNSFNSLDLETGTKAQITDRYIDGQLIPTSTLITANNSNVSIQICPFENFINEKGCTNLHGFSNSHVNVDNSILIQHNSSKGILFLEQNSCLSINNSLISQNIASSHSYSTITLQDGIQADLFNSVLEGNSALRGETINAEDQCLLRITNCTFCRNKAVCLKGRGGAIFISTQVQIFLSSCVFDNNFANHSGGAVMRVTDVIIKVKDSIFTRN